MQSDVYGSLSIFIETRGMLDQKGTGETSLSYLARSGYDGVPNRVSMESSYVTPVSAENSVVSESLTCLLRLL